MSDEKKRELCSHALENDGSLEKLSQAVSELVTALNDLRDI